MSKYTDIPATMQVIGAIYQNPSLFDNEKYKFNQEVKHGTKLNLARNQVIGQQ